MARLASTRSSEHRRPSPEERANAERLRQLIAHAQKGGRLRVFDEGANGPVDVKLTPAISTLLIEALGRIGNGDAVTLVPIAQRLTTQQAADILNVSRPHLISLLDKGDIDYEMVGRHRRVGAAALLAYKRARDRRRRESLDNLAALDGEYL